MEAPHMSFSFLCSGYSWFQTLREKRLTIGPRGWWGAEAPNDYDKYTIYREKNMYVYKKTVQYNRITTKQTLLIKMIGNSREHNGAAEETLSTLYKYIWQKINQTRRDSIWLGTLVKISVQIVVWLQSIQKQTHWAPHRVSSSKMGLPLGLYTLPFNFVSCYCVICIWAFMGCRVI